MRSPPALAYNSSLRNRGDALMVEALAQRLGPRREVVFPISVAMYAPYRMGRTVLISDLLAGSIKRRMFGLGVEMLGTVASWVPASIRHRAGISSLSEVGPVFDMSGYCYGDYWGQERAIRTTNLYKEWRGQGHQIIMMPKTWGPFCSFGTAVVPKLLEQADLVFARDDESLDRLSDAAPDFLDRVFLAPDYTHTVVGFDPDQPLRSRRLSIIPNRRMIDSGAMTAGDYMGFLRAVVDFARSADWSPQLIIHEVSGDRWFLNQLDKIGLSSDEVSVPTDHLAAKREVQSSSAVVSSRLHGIYNALNAGVPVLALGWNGKYSATMKQYGVERCLIDPTNCVRSFHNLSPLLIDDSERDGVTRSAKDALVGIRRRTEEMWIRIEATIAR